MNEILPLVLAICIALLTIALIVMAINLIAILAQVKKSLEKVNGAVDKAIGVIDTTQDKIEGILNPFHSLSAFVTNFTAGLKVTEGFMSWLNRNKIDDDAEEIVKAKKK